MASTSQLYDQAEAKARLSSARDPAAYIRWHQDCSTSLELNGVLSVVRLLRLCIDSMISAAPIPYGIHDFLGYMGFIGAFEADTVVEDVQVEDERSRRLPEGLSALVLQYKLYPAVTRPTKQKRCTWKRTFLRSHCGGNDAVANNKLAHAMALDPEFGEDGDNDIGPGDYMGDLTSKKKLHSRTNPVSETTLWAGKVVAGPFGEVSTAVFEGYEVF